MLNDELEAVADDSTLTVSRKPIQDISVNLTNNCQKSKFMDDCKQVKVKCRFLETSQRLNGLKSSLSVEMNGKNIYETSENMHSF